MSIGRCWPMSPKMLPLKLYSSGPAMGVSSGSILLHDVATISAQQVSKSSAANAFLRSALETGMNRVIADALDSIPQQNDLLDGKEPGKLILGPHRIRRTPVEKYVVEKNTMFGSVRLHTRRYMTTRPKLLTATSSPGEDEETVNWLTVRPAPRIVAAGLKYGINMTFWQTSTSWKHTLQTF